MREMKDSGVEWIEKIPKEWDAIRLKQLFSFGKGLPITKENLIDKGVAVISYGQIHSKMNNGIHIKDELIRYVSEDYIESNPNSLVKQGDFIFADTSEDTEGCGNCVYVDKMVTLFAGYHTIIFFSKSKCDNRFLGYLFKTDAWRSQIRAQVTGVKLFSISKKILSSTSVIMPESITVQNRIADYLDSKCSQIDAIIEKQQAVIEKLNEYKLSLITECVTKGLNSNVEMKDSGVEWIGKIPRNWRLSHIGNLAEVGSGGTPNRKNSEYWNGNIPWMASGEINYEYVYETAEKITELGMENSNAKMLPMNTVMLGLIGQGKTKGLTAILKTKCTCNQNLAYLIPHKELLYYEYLFYCFKAMYVYIRGIVGDSQAGIYQGFLKKQYIPLPSLDEQKTLCDSLNKCCEKINKTIADRQSAIEKLIEYKKSLIYEVVTGKKEV